MTKIKTKDSEDVSLSWIISSYYLFRGPSECHSFKVWFIDQVVLEKWVFFNLTNRKQNLPDASMLSVRSAWILCTWSAIYHSSLVPNGQTNRFSILSNDGHLSGRTMGLSNTNLKGDIRQRTTPHKFGSEENTLMWFYYKIILICIVGFDRLKGKIIGKPRNIFKILTFVELQFKCELIIPVWHKTKQ